MAKSIDLVSIFVASPSDVLEERDALQRVVNELNLMLGSYVQRKLELVRWETHSHPAIGADPQTIINRQIDPDYDVFIGIFWSRIGTPTPRAVSGTVEEFETALRRYREAHGSVEIMIYFKDAPIPPSEIDAGQLGRIQEFKSNLTNMGILFTTFQTTDDFSGLARIHLAKVAGERPLAPPSVSNNLGHVTPSAVVNIDLQDADETIVDLDDPDAGFLDYEHIFSLDVSTLTEVQQALNAATATIGAAVAQRARELNAASTDAQRRRIIESAAQDMTRYAQTVEVSLPSIKNCQERIAIAMTRALTMRNAQGLLNIEHATEFLVSLDGAIEAMRVAREGISSMRVAIIQVPNLAATINRAKRRLTNAVEQLIKTYEAGEMLFRTIRNQDFFS